MTPQAIFFYIGIASFVIFVALGVWAAVCYVRNDIRGVLDDLSGKAKRQDIEGRRKGSDSASSRSGRNAHYQSKEGKKESKLTGSKRPKPAREKASKESSPTRDQAGKKTSRELFADASYTSSSEPLSDSEEKQHEKSVEAQDEDRIKAWVSSDEEQVFDFEVIESNVVVYCDDDLLKD